MTKDIHISTKTTAAHQLVSPAKFVTLMRHTKSGSSINPSKYPTDGGHHKLVPGTLREIERMCYNPTCRGTSRRCLTLQSLRENETTWKNSYHKTSRLSAVSSAA